MKIFVVVKPKSREKKVIKIDDNHYIVHIKELPKKGKANEATIDSISSYFKVSRHSVQILSGFTSRQKLMQISIS